MAEFMACLRKLSSTCEFGTFLDQALRDRFVCGLLNDQAQKRLLTEAGLTAARALEIAQGIEAADRNTREWKSDPNLLSVHQDPCRHCGKSGHLSKESIEIIFAPHKSKKELLFRFENSSFRSQKEYEMRRPLDVQTHLASNEK